mgnify:FL=1|jgi:Tfp pilus assembly protein PilE
MKYQPGLSAVELLVALIVASIFLISGYQLYTYTFRGGTQTAQAAEASNAAYAELRKQSSIAANIVRPCPVTPPTITSVTYNGTTVKNATITTVIDCPYGNSAPLGNMNRFTTKITYTNSAGSQTITHAVLK